MNASADRQALLSLLRALPDELDAKSDTDTTQVPLLVQEPRIALNLRLGKHQFCVVHDDSPDRQAWALIECHLGPVPDDAGLTLSHLLTLNFEASSIAGNLYALDAEGGDILHTWLFNIAATTPTHLGRHLLSATALADVWQHTSRNVPPAPGKPDHASA